MARWVRATWGGWILGIPCIALLALGAEAAGVGGAQVMVGVGMGLGIGLLQAWALRGVMARLAWVVASTAGLALPFLATDVAPHLGLRLPYSLTWAVVAGGALVGGWQALLLRGRLRRPALWVPASVLGWSLAALTAGAADALFQRRALHGFPGLAAYLGLLAAGGLVLGLVTGLALTRMPAPSPSSEPGPS